MTKLKEHGVQYRVEDLTTAAPASAVIASVYHGLFDGYVHIYKDGHVEMTSPAGTVTAHFKELEKIDWLRASYIQMLVEHGVRGAELEAALAAIERVDRRLARIDEAKAAADLQERSQRRFREWCAVQGIEYDELTEEQIDEIVARGIERVRSNKNAPVN